MVEAVFHLPNHSYDELVRIIRAHGTAREFISADDAFLKSPA